MPSRLRQLEWQRENADRVNEKNRLWRQAHPEVERERQRRYRMAYPERRAAHKAVEKALRLGQMERQPCEVCGARAHAHHDDYSRPLEVRWLCRQHHAAEHIAPTSPLYDAQHPLAADDQPA